MNIHFKTKEEIDETLVNTDCRPILLRPAGLRRRNRAPSDELSTREQAEIVAAALASDKGGVGEDITTIANVPAEAARQSVVHELQRAAQASLTISVTMDFYDDQGNLQEAFSPSTTDRIDYRSLIQGDLSSANGFFQQLNIDNRSDFMATELLSGIITIDGTHSNHSSYSRTNPLTSAEVQFSLDCNLMITGLTVNLHDVDTFPESGTIEGSIAGTYERDDPFWHVSKRLNFSFVAIYQGDNTAQIELSDGTIFTIRLDSGQVLDLE